MLNQKHLAVIRAALKFLEEEMTGDSDVLVHYLHDADRELTIDSNDIVETRRLCNQSILLHASIDNFSGEFITPAPVSGDDELTYFIDKETLVSVLAPTGG